MLDPAGHPRSAARSPPSPLRTRARRGPPVSRALLPRPETGPKLPEGDGIAWDHMPESERDDELTGPTPPREVQVDEVLVAVGLAGILLLAGVALWS